MPSFFKELILDSIYKLNIADRMFIAEFEKNPSSIAEIITSDHTLNLDFIIKIAHASEQFASRCKEAIYDAVWQNQFSLLGTTLIKGRENDPVTWLHAHKKSKDLNPFDLLRGIYFYAYTVRESKKTTPFSYPELSLLREGIKYKSVHCIQRYNIYIFNECEKNNIPDEKKSELLKEAISNCKKLISAYGSYAYMMLAEAYYRYGQFLLQSGKQADFERSCNAAISACREASVHLSESTYSIHNASLGQGLQASNSFGIASPEEAIDVISATLLSASSSVVPGMSS